MDKEKEIQEIVDIITDCNEEKCDKYERCKYCYAGSLYDAGYRKDQIKYKNEWQGTVREEAIEEVLNDLYHNVAEIPILPDHSKQFLKGIIAGLSIKYNVKLEALYGRHEE